MKFEIWRLKGIKTNKSELWNHLRYRVLIYIFEVGISQMRKLRSRNPNLKFFFEKTAIFLRLEAEFFLSSFATNSLMLTIPTSKVGLSIPIVV
jgi:hypothetical protein